MCLVLEPCGDDDDGDGGDDGDDGNDDDDVCSVATFFFLSFHCITNT